MAHSNYNFRTQADKVFKFCGDVLPDGFNDKLRRNSVFFKTSKQSILYSKVMNLCKNIIKLPLIKEMPIYTKLILKIQEGRYKNIHDVYKLLASIDCLLRMNLIELNQINIDAYKNYEDFIDEIYKTGFVNFNVVVNIREIFELIFSGMFILTDFLFSWKIVVYIKKLKIIQINAIKETA